MSARDLIREAQALLAIPAQDGGEALGCGQIWKHKDGGVYIAVATIDVILLASIESGNRWSDDDIDAFEGQAKDFVYLGMACDLLTIKGQA